MVPREWKRANITPLFKKGSRTDPGNYRPVSLTSHVGKILEVILKEKLLHHLTLHSLINASQHGFLPKKSCLTNLLDFLEYVTDAVTAVSILISKRPLIRFHMQDCYINCRHMGYLEKYYNGLVNG